MKEKTKSYVDQNGKILKHFCYFFFSTLKETFPVHRYLYKHCNKSANTSGSWCNRNPTKNTHVLTSSKRSLSSHRERPCRSFLMLTQSRVSVAPILGRRRLKEGGGGWQTHTLQRRTIHARLLRAYSNTNSTTNNSINGHSVCHKNSTLCLPPLHCHVVCTLRAATISNLSEKYY